VKIVEHLVLWDSPLGKMVDGAYLDLFEAVSMTGHKSRAFLSI